MLIRVLLAVVVGSCLASCGGSGGEDFKPVTLADITVTQAFVREPDSDIILSRLEIVNTGSQEDQLIAMGGAGVKSVFFQEAAKSGVGAAVAWSTVEAIPVAPRDTLVLDSYQAKGTGVAYYSLMWSAPRVYKIGEKVPITLTFKKAGKLTVEVPVVPSQGRSEPMPTRFPAGQVSQ